MPSSSVPNPGSGGETLETQNPSEAPYDLYYTPTPNAFSVSVPGLGGTT